MRADICDYVIRILAANHILVSVFHPDKETIGRFAIKSIIAAYVSFLEYSPIPHEAARREYPDRAHRGPEQLNAFYIPQLKYMTKI
jgi:hypothetical protein